MDESMQGLRKDLRTLNLNDAQIATVLEFIDIINKKNVSLSDKINAVKRIIQHVQETYPAAPR